MSQLKTAVIMAMLSQVATAHGISVKEYVESQGFAKASDVVASVETLNNKINSITEMEDNGVESLAEKVKAINDVLVGEDGTVQQIFSKVTENKLALQAEILRATNAESALQDAINANGVKIDSNINALSNLSATVNSNRADLDNLSSYVNDKLLTTDDVQAICACEIDNAFRTQLGLSANVCDSAPTGDGAVL